MKFLDFDEISKFQDLNEEIDFDNIFNKALLYYFKISIVAACFYCASTESRFIEEKNMMHLHSTNIILESYIFIF